MTHPEDMLWRMSDQRGRNRMQALDRLGGRQLGLVTVAQLERIGYRRRARQYAVTALRLHHVRRGVYRLPGVVATWESTVLAAVLAAGPRAVASHFTAAQLWSLF